MENCIFCKVIRGDFNTNFIYEDEEIVVFNDINPKAKTHLLFVPKKHMEELMSVEDTALIGKMFAVMQKMVKKHELSGKGFKVITNGGGAQEVDHLHIHLIGPVGKAIRM